METRAPLSAAVGIVSVMAGVLGVLGFAAVPAEAGIHFSKNTGGSLVVDTPGSNRAIDRASVDAAENLSAPTASPVDTRGWVVHTRREDASTGADVSGSHLSEFTRSAPQDQPAQRFHVTMRLF